MSLLGIPRTSPWRAQLIHDLNKALKLRTLHHTKLLSRLLGRWSNCRAGAIGWNHIGHCWIPFSITWVDSDT